MQVADILRTLDLGSSVAEFDTALERYFVETETFRLLTHDSIDTVAGDKGTGKTALFQILQKRYTVIEQMTNVEVVPGFNISGAPVFQRLIEAEELDEGRYITIWKAYVVSLVGNWILQLYEDAYTDRMFELDKLLTAVGLRTKDDSPTTVFSQIVNLVKRLLKPESIEMAVFTPSGLPIISTKVELGPELGGQSSGVVPHEVALSLLNEVLNDIDVSIWIVLDRLDEAFQGFPQIEVPALRALFRTFLDLGAFPRLRLKLFVRKDLFRKIIQGGFVNLTHINARKVEINWTSDDLFALLCKRMAENREFIDALGLGESNQEDLFAAVFPEQVDQGSRKPKTWTWILRRIRDGNDVAPPRNLIDLVKKALNAQLKHEERKPREHAPGVPLITPDALKLGLEMLSSERVEDTLLAEAGDAAPLIEAFRGGKAEHDSSTLEELLGLQNSELKDAIQALTDIGFLEPVGTNYKVPALYRDGLAITQGKAF